MEWTEETWRGLIESAPDALVLVEPGGTIVFTNSQTRNLFGYEKNELLGQAIERLLPERFRSGHIGKRTQYFDSPRVRPMGAGIELFGLHRDGHEIPVEISLSPLKTKNGMLVTAAIRDISERRRAAEELRKAREVAEAANRAKSEFLANMSHEIRTPLAGILGYTEMIALYCNSDDERKGYMEKVRRCTDTLTELINDILDLSKVEAGALRVEWISFNPVSEVENVVNLLQARATEKKIHLEVKYDRPLPLQITSDPTRVRQILSNLIGNAIKFTDSGQVLVRTFEDSNDSRRIVFEVSDTGCGLSQEEQTRLFRTFSQADSSTTRRYGGTGLGLALSRRLAQALEGELILVKSSPSQGSTFRLSIPIRSHFVTPREAEPMGEKKKVEGVRLDGVRVLIVEDNADNRELLERFLTAHGASVDLALDGIEATGKVELAPYDILLIDLQMPRLDGYEVTKRLRTKGMNLPIIVLTAHAMAEEREKSYAAGCDEFVTKPIDIPKLLKIIQRHTLAKRS